MLDFERSIITVSTVRVLSVGGFSLMVCRGILVQCWCFGSFSPVGVFISYKFL